MRSLAPSRMPSVHCLRSARSMRAALRNGTALRTILAAAELLRAKACAVISPDPLNSPQEMARTALLKPVYAETFDLVITHISKAQV